MTPSASSHPHRMIRRVAAVVGLTAMLVAAFGLGAYAYDPHLDDADAALEKAGVLLLTADPGTTDVKAQRKFEKYVSRAIADIDDARAAIQEAEAVVH